MVQFIVNADDFGASKGINKAIETAFKDGCLNSTSLMVTMRYVSEAVSIAKENPELKVGLHLNLTNEYSACKAEKIPLLVNKDGKFKNGFLNLFILSLLHPIQFRKQILKETIAQVLLYKKTGLEFAHIDSHRHVHHIPAIFKIVRKVAKKYNIDRIRVVNERVFHTYKCNKDRSFLFDGGLIKWAVLKSMYVWNHYFPNVYFYTILYTGKIYKSRFENFKMPAGFEVLEIGIHPGMPELDKDDHVFDEAFLLPARTKEFETVSTKNLLDDVL